MTNRTAPAASAPRVPTMAALLGEVVTQAHADYCAAHGHATHTVDGTDTGVCPRCGEVTTPAPTTRTRSAARTEFLSDVLCAALEGGVGYWSQADAIERTPDESDIVGWYYSAVTLRETADGDTDCSVSDGECKGHRVTLDSLASAIGRFTRGKRDDAAAALKVHPSYVRTIREANAENDGGEIDADLADMIVQVAALGAVVYG